MANRTYRYFKGPVLYPFGFGLSYSHFEYGKPEIAEARVKAGETVTVKVRLTNTSAVEGDEVAQVYVTPPHTPVSPRLALEGFQRVHLAAGEGRELTFVLDPRLLSEVDATGKRREMAGDYEVYVGGAQPTGKDANVAPLHVTGEVALPR
jgi:beta-glucosidase